MENLKIKVNNEAESGEAQALLLKSGYKLERLNKYEYPQYMAFNPAEMTFKNYVVDAYVPMLWKEITLQELRDKVVLKRNDVGDATHTCNGQKYYLTASEFFEYINGHWENVDEYVDGCVFEPIQESTMTTPQHKEYLDPQNNYELIEWDGGFMIQYHWIEVPKGAEVLADTCLGLIFYKKKDHKSFEFYDENGFCGWSSTPTNPYDKSGVFVRALVWQRHTQPEALPFIDDEPKHSHYFKDVSDVDLIDVYDVLLRFGVTDPCLQHIVKKALCAGERGHKDFNRDLKDIADTAQRALVIHGAQ